MARTFGRTREEMRASTIAQHLLDALCDVERFTGDVTLITDQLSMARLRPIPQGTKEAIQALLDYYDVRQS